MELFTCVRNHFDCARVEGGRCGNDYHLTACTKCGHLHYAAAIGAYVDCQPGCRCEGGW